MVTQKPSHLESWMHSDPDAVYAATIHVDARALSPMVARPGVPGLGIAIADLAERPRVDIAFGGSCTAGKREDFAQYHAVLSWAAQRGMKVAPGVTLYLQFGTEHVRDYCTREGWLAAFEAVGAVMLQPACGACANCGPGASTSSEQVTVSAINRNFPGRSGPGNVWLASPATTAASAIAGTLASFRELMTGKIDSRVRGRDRKSSRACNVCFAASNQRELASTVDRQLSVVIALVDAHHRCPQRSTGRPLAAGQFFASPHRCPEREAAQGDATAAAAICGAAWPGRPRHAPSADARLCVGGGRKAARRCRTPPPAGHRRPNSGPQDRRCRPRMRSNSRSAVSPDRGKTPHP